MSLPAFTIRPEAAADGEAIARVIQAAFDASEYGNHGEHQIVATLRQRGALTVSLVAEVAEAVIGHVAISPVSLSDQSPGWYGLGPLSVAPEWQRRGVGAGLTAAALEALTQSGAAGCVVLGDPGYYGRFGFVADAALTLDGVPPQYFQALRLSDARAAGEVRYHPAFAASD